uniref:CARD domain-containing protein n=1 Tax=Plectus sambesii TaxID=2011161 RepID=A0A914WHN8_9BILA
MDFAHLALLNKHQYRLINEMAPEEVVSHLMASGTLLEHHGNEIKKYLDYEEKNCALLKLLKQQGKSAFENFLEALKETRQCQLWELLQEQSPKVGSGQQMQRVDSSDSFMDKLKKLEQNEYETALTRSLSYICITLAIKEVLKQMEAAEVIENATLEKIRSEKLFYNQHRELVNYLMQSNKNTFGVFVDALISTGQTKVAKKIADLSSCS